MGISMCVEIRSNISDLLSSEHGEYEVRFSPANKEFPTRISCPVSKSRALEIADYLLTSLLQPNAWAVPEEFRIVGRIEYHKDGHLELVDKIGGSK